MFTQIGLPGVSFDRQHRRLALDRFEGCLEKNPNFHSRPLGAAPLCSLITPPDRSSDAPVIPIMGWIAGRQ
jgi:hypothetical protein